MSKKPKTASREGYGILNPYGDMWSSNVFDTMDEASEYLRNFWRKSKPGADLSAYKIVKAKQTAKYLADPQ
jgi:hypothetical protein